MKLFDSAQGAFIKYHYFPRTHILTLQREVSHEYFKKKKNRKGEETKPPRFLFKNIHLWGEEGLDGIRNILMEDGLNTGSPAKGAA